MNVLVWARFLRDGIEPSGMEGVAPEDPPDGEEDTAHGPMHFYGLGGIVRAGGIEPAVVAGYHRGDEPLVQPDQTYEED